MPTKLYTFIMDYGGGTYISQASGETCQQAKENWARTVDLKQMGIPLSSRSRDRFVARACDDDAVPVTGVVGTWCFSVRMGKGIALVHVVETLQ